MAEIGAGLKMASTLQTVLASQLPDYLLKQRWFGGKARKIASVDVVDTLPIPVSGGNAFIFIARVHYADGADEFYAIPLVRSEGAGAEGLKVPGPDGGSIMLADGLKNASFLTALAELIENGTAVAGEKGELRGLQTTAYSKLSPEPVAGLAPKPVGAEQSNTSIIYGNRLILKFFRRIQEGLNPDLEIGQFLTEKTSLTSVPPLAGTLEYQARDGKPMAQGMLQKFVANQGDAWGFTLKSLDNYYEEVRRIVSTGTTAAAGVTTAGKNTEAVPDVTLDVAKSAVEVYLAAAELLGQRTAEMHLALASDASDPAFAPEPFTAESQQALEQSVSGLLVRVFSLLRDKMKYLPNEWRGTAEKLAERESEIAARFNTALREPIRAMRTRIHGDYHLGQVLRTESDFVIIDFEGEPARSIAERRVKRSPLQDVAGMLRSFHYAAFAPLLGEDRVQGDDVTRMGVWAEAWNSWVAERYLAKYFATANGASYLPATQGEIQTVLELHLLEKAIYELGYELNNRPTWVGIPLQGISKLLSS